MARLILDYLDVLIWPGMTVVLALIFRDSVRNLLARVVSAKALGVCAQFAMVEPILGSDTIPRQVKSEVIDRIVANYRDELSTPEGAAMLDRMTSMVERTVDLPRG